MAHQQICPGNEKPYLSIFVQEVSFSESHVFIMVNHMASMDFIINHIGTHFIINHMTFMRLHLVQTRLISVLVDIGTL